MSLVTACPACHTQFEVSDEQLQAYDGKVRCGECQYVFDAPEHLVVTQEVSHSVASHTSTHSASENIHANNLAVSPDASLAEEANIYVPELVLDDVLTDAPVVPEFLRNISLDDERNSVVTTSQENGLYFILVIVLVIGLLVQSVYFSRDYLASHFPRIKPTVVYLCKKLHCEIRLSHDLAELTIDDADIQEHREREGILVFSSVLINHGSEVQAYPDIELTLTNTTDEAVMRRILKPVEYLHSAKDIETGLTRQEEIAVKANLAVNDPAVTGFRVTLGY